MKISYGMGAFERAFPILILGIAQADHVLSQLDGDRTESLAANLAAPAVTGGDANSSERLDLSLIDDSGCFDKIRHRRKD